MSKQFAHLHNHSEYSLLDGAQTTEAMAQKGAELGLSALSITDHGRMGGCVDFYTNCKKYGVKPILGIEAYITGIGRSRKDRIDWQRQTKEFAGTPKYERNNYHLILLAKNEQGYDNLCQLSTESYSTGFYQKPRIDYELLEKYKDGLIVSSACIIGEVSNRLLNNDYAKAREVALWFKKTFGDDYYLEILNHNLAIEMQVMQPIRQLADELGIKVIATNDDHYTNKQDHKIQKTLMLLGMHKSWADSDVKGTFFGVDDEYGQQSVSDSDTGDSDPIFETPAELYMKSYDEMLEALLVNGGENGVAERELDNTNEIADKCNFELPIIDPEDTSAYFLADYPIKDDTKYQKYEEEKYETPQYVIDACIEEMHKLGHTDVHKLSDFMSEHDIEALRFLMYLCDDGIERLIKPKVNALGEPLDMSYWIDNPPEGFEVKHAHNSPDELWIKNQIANGKTSDDIIQIYRDRLAYELSIVCAKRFVNYFLIVQSYINYTREQGSSVGPGRGSGAGSLVCYLSGITAVDPIPNDLMFERFLNPDRRGYPDVDTDFSGDFRDNVLWPHIREVYGKNNTSAVAAYTYYWGKAAVKAAARVLFDCSNDKSLPEQVRKTGKDTSVSLGNALADLIDNKPKLDLNGELDGSNEMLTDLIKTDERYRQIIDLALILQGRISGEGQHASAYIVSPHPITNRMPLMTTKDERDKSQQSGKPVDNYLIQYDGRTTQDKLGYVKLDLLCINDLEVITTALGIIKRVYGCTIDIENIPLDDSSAFELVQEGHNTGLFQFDGSPVAGRLLIDSQADCIGDWSAVNALNRPGPLQQNFDVQFVNGKLHPETVTYFTPAAEKYLKDTYAVVAYQEELMLLSQDKQIVGFTGGEADTMRKILAHKDKAKIQGIVDLAHERAAENGVPKEVVDKFCDIAVAAGSYSFNKCSTGDTLLHRANSCHRDKNYPEPDIPIEEVYRRFNASAARNSPDLPIRNKYRSKRPDRGLFIMCRDADGRARKHKVKNVYQQGVQPVYKVALENGKTIKVTANHRLQARDCYKRVDELVAGEDELWCCDFIYDDKPTRKYNWSDVTEDHRGARGIGKHMGGNRCGENNAMYTNGGWTKFKHYKETHTHCEIDGYDKCTENGDRIEIHHINGDRTNNEDSNLQALCVSHHKQVHFDNGRRKHGEKGYETYLSKVVSIEYAGEEMTYDVEMDSEEHNFFANGISSHNSHSLAYAIIAYRGAFLKAHFPEAFLAAMCQLKPDQKGKNKIPDYLEDARQLGVEVLPPHVNYSLVAFDVPRNGAIAYGLERIKGVGKSAQPIVDEREKNGPYTDFTDFCCRVPREVGKSALLPLIRYGALDGLGWSRKAMIESIDDVIAFRKKWFDEQERRQSIETNIFDMFSLPTAPPASPSTFESQQQSDQSSLSSTPAPDASSASSDAAPSRPYERTVELVPPFDDEYTERELLRQQKETLGMCLSCSFEDYSQLNRFRIEREMRETYAKKVRTGSYNSKHDPLPIMVADVPHLPNQRLVEMMCVVSDPEGKNRDNPRMFRSGKGCSIFVYDHGANEESRFGFSPRRYTTKLTVFSRTWDSLPVFPRPGDVLHIIGRISIDADSNFPPAVIVDQLDVIDEDSALFGKMSREELMQLQKDFNEYKRHVSDPNDDRYLIPVLEFETKEDMDEFLDAPGTQKYMGNGRVQVISDDEASTLKKIVNLKQTRGMVKWAAGFGAKAYKTRLPKAQSAIDRAKLMKSEEKAGGGESGDGGGADTGA